MVAWPVLYSAEVLPTAKELISAAHALLEAPDVRRLVPPTVPSPEPGVPRLLVFVTVGVDSRLFLSLESRLKQQCSLQHYSQHQGLLLELRLSELAVFRALPECKLGTSWVMPELLSGRAHWGTWLFTTEGEARLCGWDS